MSLKHLEMLTKVNIDLLHPRDVAQTAALFRYIVSTLPYYNDATRRLEVAKYSEVTLQAMIGSKMTPVLTAKSGERCIGFCISRYDEGTIWLSWYGVHPHWRGYAVGGALLEALVTRTVQQGIHKIWCACHTDNQPSRRSLRKAGFEELCTLRNHWYGQDYSLLQKFLC